MKNRRTQDERHSLFNVCSVGRLVVLSLSMSLLILNQEVVIQFFIGQNSQNPICMYPTLSPYIIRNHQKYIAAWTNCPTNWEAIMSQRFLPLFLSRRANGLAYSSISPTHQRFMLQKTNIPWYPFSTLHQHMKLLIKRHTSCNFHFNYTKTWNYWSKDIYPVHPFSTTQLNMNSKLMEGYHLRLIVTFIVGQPVLLFLFECQIIFGMSKGPNFHLHRVSCF